MTKEEEIAALRERLASQVAKLAMNAVALASEHGVALDFTEGSLEALDRCLGQFAAASISDEEKERATQLFAAYLLEVGRRAHGGYFQWWYERKAPVLCVGDPDCHIGMLAIDKVRGRIGGDDADNIPYFYAGFAERARRRKPGDSATYV
jgi:hypothetical protein